MNLYEIARAMEALVDPETGELGDYGAYQALAMERGEKLEQTALWIKDLKAMAASIQAEERALAERRQRMERRAERLREYLQAALEGETLETARCSVKYRKSTAVELEDPSLAAEALEDMGFRDLVAYLPPKIDRRELGRLLKNGMAVPGAALVSRRNMIVK